MGRNNKYSKETKVKAIKEYKKGIKSISEICRELNCNHRSFLNWLHMFDRYGETIFNDKMFNNSYTKDFKEKVIKEYLSGSESIRQIQEKNESF